MINKYVVEFWDSFRVASFEEIVEAYTAADAIVQATLLCASRKDNQGKPTCYVRSCRPYKDKS